MVIRDASETMRIISFAASFFYKAPIGLLRTDKINCWQDMYSILSREIGNKMSVVDEPLQQGAIANFPIGKPLVIKKNSQLMEMYKEDIYAFLVENEILSKNDEILINHEIWICPTGVILLIISIDANAAPRFGVKGHEITIEYITQNYYELTYEILDIIRILDSTMLTEKCDCGMSLNKYEKIFDVAQALSNKVDLHLLKSIDKKVKGALEEALCDVYFVFPSETVEETIETNYYRSIIRSDCKVYDEYLMMVYIAFVSFWSFHWIDRYLNQTLDYCQNALYGLSTESSQIVKELKLVRLYAMQIINESSPMRIRLTAEYMECLEDCWKQFRMQTIVGQIKDSLVRVSEMIEWFDSIYKEIRDYKIGAIGLLYAFIACLDMAVAFADSLLLDNKVKLAFVLIAGMIGVMLTCVILIIPRRWIYHKIDRPIRFGKQTKK